MGDLEQFLDVNATADIRRLAHATSSSRRRATMRTAAFPSQNSGTPQRTEFMENNESIRSFTTAGSVPANTLLPISTVIGRSVFSRIVMHGIRKYVVSS